MLTDDWVISQLFVQAILALLLVYAFFKSVKIIRFWQYQQNTALQLRLEQESYLVGNILQVALVVEIFLSVYFLQTINHHIPPLLRGAMCATGALNANKYGYAVLYAKILFVLLAIAFLLVDEWDIKTPYFSLTPAKYYLLIPVMLVFFGEFVGSFLYFSALNPDIIATCCSVNALINASADNVGDLENIFSANKSFWVAVSFYFFYVAGVIILLTHKQKTNDKIDNYKIFYQIYKFLLINVWIGNAVFLLKNFFVKYIYGVPSHDCLFDIFWGEYYFVGYIIFFGYLYVWTHCLREMLFYFFEKNIKEKNIKIGEKSALQKDILSPKKQKFQWLYLAIWIMNIILPTIFYVMWEGEL